MRVNNLPHIVQAANHVAVSQVDYLPDPAHLLYNAAHYYSSYCNSWEPAVGYRMLLPLNLEGMLLPTWLEHIANYGPLRVLYCSTDVYLGISRMAWFKPTSVVLVAQECEALVWSIFARKPPPPAYSGFESDTRRWPYTDQYGLGLLLARARRALTHEIWEGDDAKRQDILNAWCTRHATRIHCSYLRRALFGDTLVTV